MEQNLLLFGLWNKKILHAVVGYIIAEQDDQSHKFSPKQPMLVIIDNILRPSKAITYKRNTTMNKSDEQTDAPAYQIIGDTHAKINGLNAAMADIINTHPDIVKSKQWQMLDEQAIDLCRQFFAGVDREEATKISAQINELFSLLDELRGKITP